jgi:hypothetical protein
MSDSAGIAARLMACCMIAVLAACDSPSTPDRRVQRSIELAADCDPLQACQLQDAELPAVVRMGPDIRALQPFSVAFNSSHDPGIEDITVSFSMKGMDMGSNRYRLERNRQGGWQAQVTLPICISGRSDWLADFEVRTADQRLQFSIPFILQK